MRLYEVTNNIPKAIPTKDSELRRNYDYMDSEELLEVLNSEMGFVLDECSQIISEYRKAEGLLYRGLRRKELVIELPIRHNRRPMEMEPHFAKMLEAAYETFGITAHRQNSIFTTPMIEVTQTWGDTYIVFPKNGYKFSYFTEIQQGQYAFDLLRQACSEALRGPKGEKITDTMEQAATIYGIMEELGITETNMTFAIKRGCEVLIHGSSYYAFDHQHWGSAIQRWLRI